jgi:C-terminal processing protease CtpA/Prc
LRALSLQAGLRERRHQDADEHGDDADHDEQLDQREPDSPADAAGIKRGMVLYRVNKSTAVSVKQVDEALRGVQSGASVEFTIGIVRARGENHELAALTLKAR